MLRRLVLPLLPTALFIFAPALAQACDIGVPNTHIGVVTAVDPAAQRMTLKDAQSGKSMMFSASQKLLLGIAVNDKVSIEYALEDKAMRATAIKKN